MGIQKSHHARRQQQGKQATGVENTEIMALNYYFSFETSAMIGK